MDTNRHADTGRQKNMYTSNYKEYELQEKDVDKSKRVNNIQKMIARERERERERGGWTQTHERERERERGGRERERERVLLCILIYDRVGPGR